LLYFFSIICPSSVYANFVTYPSPIIAPGIVESWDSWRVHGPSLLFENDQFNLWYTGGNNSLEQIGFATASSINNFQKELTNPIIRKNVVPSSVGLQHPVILVNSNIFGHKYNMWFHIVLGNYDAFKLYYSYSDDKILWSTPTEVIFSNTAPYWDTIGNTAPTVIFDGNQFHMWYTARGTIDGITRWRIGHAKSSNGVVWEKDNNPTLDSNQTWENPNGQDGLANANVYYENGIYHMFYHSNYSIGHAYSTDLITWTKSENNPIINPSNILERFDSYRVMDPYLLKNGEFYYLFFTGVGSNISIGYATSDNLPPVVTPSITNSPSPTLSFTPTSTPASTPTDTPIVTPTYTPSTTPTRTPTITSTLTNAPSLTPTPTNIPIPTNTPSPTLMPPTPTTTYIPTSTPTSSPSITYTPTPIVVTATLTPTPKPIIIILPGLGASWNPEDIFSCDLSKSGNWKLAPYVSIYNRLIKTFTNNVGLKINNDVYLYSYDWRQPLNKQGINFKSYLDKLLSNKPIGTKANLIGHSLGGLVIRSYLTQYPNENKILNAITAGSPHQGTILAYPTWENGEFWTTDRVEKIALDQVVNHCRISLTIKPKVYTLAGLFLITRKEALQKASPIIRDILPTFDYIMRNNNLIKNDTLIHQNLWLQNNPTLPSLPHTNIYSLSGTNNDTLRLISVVTAIGKDAKAGNWQDGVPIFKSYSKEGDGTVLNLSSQLPNISNKIIPGNHADIISSTNAIQEILNIIGYPSFSPVGIETIVEKESNPALTISTDSQAIISLTDPKGKISENKDDKILVSYNPLIGIYKLKIKPNQTGKGYLYINRYETGKEDRSLSQEISFTKNKESNFLIINTPLQTPKVINFPI
jgi:predicted GH43/DUF377 family glycosyl hydrolase/pimeloyl-ACP methyl ester carboxylesterase